MHIGLIGGIGPAATDFYYRRIIGAFGARKATLELTMVHAETSTLLGNLGRNDVAAQVGIYLQLTERLVKAGAGCVVVTSIAGHFCIGEFEAVSPLPVVNLITEVRREVEARGLRKVGILGTRTVMASGFYGGLEGVEVMAPRGEDLNAVHEAYVAMAVAGVVNEEQRGVFERASAKLMEGERVEAILLGGTDLALVFDEKTSEYPLVDCAAIHVDSIVRVALGS